MANSLHTGGLQQKETAQLADQVRGSPTNHHHFERVLGSTHTDSYSANAVAYSSCLLSQTT